MADKPIPFSAPMIRALIAGAKTQTRRVIKPRRRCSLFDGTWSDSYVLDAGNASWRADDVRYAVGDRLYVKEAWRTQARYDDRPPRDVPVTALVSYEADYDREPNDGCRGRYRHARFMCRWASRLTLLVTDVRVQRLQEVSEDDAKAEGVPWPEECDDGAATAYEPSIGHFRSEFSAIWNSINGPDAWAANPWVCAVSFEAHHRNIDQMEARQCA